MKNVDFSYEKDKQVLSNINLNIEEGSVNALVGESGSGKSTTAHSIINLLPGTGKVTAGEIIFDGKDISKVSEKDFDAWVVPADMTHPSAAED